MMRRIHLVGRKNHGKTTLLVELIEFLTRQGLRVGAIKHTSHRHELDVPGKDSHRHRAAGASPAAVAAADLIAVYLPRLAGDDCYDRLAAAFSACDLVLVEGDLGSGAAKVEVWRAAAGGDCLASERGDIAAVITDDRPRVAAPLWPRSDLPRLAKRILALAGIAIPPVGTPAAPISPA